MRLLLLVCGILSLAGPAIAAPDMTFSLASDGRSSWIVADGEIMSNTPAAFDKFLSAQRPARGVVVKFNSSGGVIPAAVDLGFKIRGAGLSTDVARTVGAAPGAQTTKGVCASACAYAYLGGVRRSLETGSRYGVHQFYSVGSEGSDESAQIYLALLSRYMTEMGVDNELLVLAALTAADSMQWLDKETLRNLMVLNSTPGGTRGSSGRAARPRVR